MSEPAFRDIRHSSRSATVIPFPTLETRETTSTVEPIASLSDLLLQEQQFDRLRQIAESAVAAFVLNRSLSTRSGVESPFDAVYISALEPDFVSSVDLKNVKDFSGIQDVSDTLVIDDGWDD